MMYSNDHQIEALQAFAGLWIAAIACFVVVTVLRIAFVCSGLAKMSTDHSWNTWQCRLQMCCLRRIRKKQENERLAQLREQYHQCRAQYYRQLRLQLRARQSREVMEPFRQQGGNECGAGEAPLELEMGVHPPLISYDSSV